MPGSRSLRASNGRATTWPKGTDSMFFNGNGKMDPVGEESVRKWSRGVSGSRAKWMMGFPHRRVPSTRLGTKQEKVIHKPSSSASSRQPPSCLPGQRLKKGQSGHLQDPGGVASAQPREAGRSCSSLPAHPHPHPDALAAIRACVTMYTNIGLIHTCIGLEMVTHSPARSQLTLPGHRVAPWQCAEGFLYHLLEFQEMSDP